MSTRKRPTTSKRKTARVGERIVRAWFDTVINPLLQKLNWEQSRLQAKNWTWRFQFKHLESIQPIRALLPYELQDNLDQFLNFYPVIRESIGFHDDQRMKLLVACQNLQHHLQESEDLRRLYEGFTSENSLQELGTRLEDIFGAYKKREEHISVLAEHIVNNTGELPSYYTTASFWNKHRQDFLSLLDTGPINTHNRLAVRAGEQLLKLSNRLTQLLRKTRERLSIEYDMPYVTSPAFVE